MLTELTFATAFIAIVGVIIFFVGLSAFSRGLKYRSKNAVFTGTVAASRHMTRRNDKNELIQNYYQLHVRCFDGKKTYNADLKSPDEYQRDDEVRLTRKDSGETILYKDNGIRWYNGAAEMLIGAGIAWYPFAVNRMGDPYASFILAGVLVLGAALMTEVFARDRRRQYEELDAEVTDILLYDVESQRKVLKINSWYPIIRYERAGETREFLSESNSSVRSAYTVGKKLKVYRDAETGEVREKRASVVLPVLSAGFLILALMGVVSVI